MFEDQTVELLPERTVMGTFQWAKGGRGGNGGLAIAVAVNAGNVNFGDDQVNLAAAYADASGGDGGDAINVD